MAINKVSEITKTRIKEQSVLSLPDKPSEKGYGAQQLKEFFTNIVVGDIGALAEIDRVVVELNRYLDGLENTSIKNYVLDSIISKFVEQGPFTSLKFEENKLKYTKFGNPTISGEIDIIPDNSVFFNSETLQNKDGAIIYPKTTLDNIVDKMDDKSVKEFLLNLKTKINEIESNHKIDIKTIEDNLNAILGGDAPAALNSIKELAEALKNNPSSIDDILQQLSNLKTNKVDKVSGKGLSTNDYDNNTKAFVDELRNKDVALKTDIKTSLSQMQQDSNFRTVRDADIDYWNSKADNVHYHEIKHVSGLQQKLDMKSDTNHTHTLSNIGIDIAGISEQYVSTHNKSSSSHQDIRDEIKEVKNKVDGINNALSFENVSQLTAWFGGTYNRADGKKPSDLYIGQHIYLKDQDEDDYWVSVVPANMSNLSILETDKIDLAEYAQKNELKRVAFTGSYTDLENKPSIPTTLADLSSDAEHAHITQEQVEQIETNKNNITNKLDKALGSSEANKMIVTDSEGNVVTAEAGSMAVMVDNLNSTSTDMALAANQGRVLDNKKLDKQQGSENAGKFLKVSTDGLIEYGDVDVSSKLDKNNPTGTGWVSINRKASTNIGSYSIAIGYENTASGNYSFASGWKSKATGGTSHAEGDNTEASGAASHSEGGQTHATGQHAHAEGYQTYAKKQAAHSEGMNTQATNFAAHSEGYYSVASGSYSHAEGSGTTASGESSHTEGYTTTASGKNSHAGGTETTANHKSQHVFGEFNVLDTSTAESTERGNYVEIVGNGTALNSRSNARTLDWDGNETLAGKLYVNGDQEVATLEALKDAGGYTKLDSTDITLNELPTGAYIVLNDAYISTSYGAAHVDVGAGSTIFTTRSTYQVENSDGSLADVHTALGTINANGVGSTLPLQYNFYDDGEGGSRCKITSTYNFISGQLRGDRIYINENGTIGGNLTVGGYVDAYSDIRLKENIDIIDENKVKALIENTLIKAFNYKSNGNRTVGLIAQDIKDTNINGAEFTDTNEEGFLSVRESKFVYLLWNYCQQLNKRIEELEKRK